MHRTGGGPVPGMGLDVAAWAREAFALTGRLPGVRRVGLALTEGGGRRHRFTASERDDGPDAEWCHIDAYEDVPLNTAIRTGTLVHGAVADLAGDYPDFAERQREAGTAGVAAVPLVAAGQVLGGVVLFYDRPQAFDEAQRLELEQAGQELGSSLRRARGSRSRRAVDFSDEPVPTGARVAVHLVPPDPAAVAGARRFLRRTLAEWHVPEETADTAVLCLSELVTNAVMHTHAGCGVRVVQDRGVLVTTVRDSGPVGTRGTEPLEDPLRVHGRGLQVVDALAARWGSEPDEVGTSVWFVLDG